MAVDTDVTFPLYQKGLRKALTVDGPNLVLREKLEMALGSIEDLRMACARLEVSVAAGTVSFLEKTKEFSTSLENFKALNEVFEKLKAQIVFQIDNGNRLVERESRAEKAILSIEDHLVLLEKNKRRVKHDGMKIALTIILLMIALIIHMVMG